MNKILSELYKQTFIYRKFHKKAKKIGLSFDEYCCFISGIDNGKSVPEKTFLLGKEIIRTNKFWYAQCVLELFEDEVYKFNSNNTSPVIIDCGTNIGLSLIYFKRLYPNSIITGFEADPQIFDICKKNLATFGYSDIELINAAVWKEEGMLSFLSDNALGGKVGESEDGKNQVIVKAVDLVPFLNKRIDFLKIDIEGAEFAVLKKCENYLTNVERLFVEYHSSYGQSQELGEMLNIIKKAGFRYYIKEAWSNLKYPFVDNRLRNSGFDLQLNIFCYR